jgi:hypothetical protein
VTPSRRRHDDWQSSPRAVVSARVRRARPFVDVIPMAFDFLLLRGRTLAKISYESMPANAIDIASDQRQPSSGATYFRMLSITCAL